MTRVFVSAAEPSADLHAAPVVRLLKARGVAVDAIGGPNVEAAGARLIGHMDALSAVGLVEAAGSIPAHVALLRAVDRRFHSGQYDAVLLVDYPGFHLRVAARAARRDIPVLYYIAPQVWAWGTWRIRALRRHVRHVAVILPFEQAFFTARGVPATFVGHPLLDRARGPDRATARRTLGIPAHACVLAVVPGRRETELRRHAPLFRAAARRLESCLPGLHVLMAGGPAPVDLAPAWRVCDAGTAFAAADVALCKSGTSTLEAALAGLPMVIAYRMHPITYAMARRAVRVPSVGLSNLIAGRPIAPELLQRAATPESLSNSLLPLFDRDGPGAVEQRAAWSRVRAALGQPGAARRVADLTGALAA